MGYLPNLVDIDSYCDELSNITRLDVNKIKSIVLIQFANIANGNISFPEATENIECALYGLMSPEKPVQKLAL